MTLKCMSSIIVIILLTSMLFSNLNAPGQGEEGEIACEACEEGGPVNDLKSSGSRGTWEPFFDHFENLDNWDKTGDIEWGVGGGTYLYLEGNGRTSNTEEGGAVSKTGLIPAFESPCSIKFRYTTSDSFEGYQGDEARCYVSDDNGGNWHKIWQTTSEHKWSWQETGEIDLSGYDTASGQFRVYFWLHCNYKNDDFLVDWVRITAHQNDPPTKPGTISPDTTGDKTPTVSWGESTDPDGDTVTYEYQVGTSSGSDDVKSWTSTDTNNQVTASQELSVNTYYIQVRAYDGQDYSEEREETLKITNTPPNAVEYIDPNSTGDRTPTISWPSAEDPDPDDTIDEYQIRIEKDSGNEFLDWTSTGTQLSYKVQTLMDFITYYVQVKAFDGYEWSPVTEEELLIDEAANSPPDPPAWITPDSTQNVQPQVQWAASEDPDGDPITDYKIRIGSSPGGRDILNWTSTGGDRMFDVQSQLSVDTYYVQVKAYDGNSWGGANEEPMDILNTPPNPPTVLKADDQALPAEVYSKSPLITWTGDSDINTEQTLSYYFRLESAAEGVLIDWAATKSDKYYQIGDGLSPGDYTVKVRVNDTMSYSSILSESMTIGNHPPSPVSTVTPDETNVKSPTLVWPASSDEDGDDVGYWLRIGTSPDTGDVLSWTYVGTMTSYVPDNKLQPGTYYVQLVSYDGFENATSVLEETLVIINNPPTKVARIYPDATPQLRPNISWDPSSDEDGDPLAYELRIGTGMGSTDVLNWTDAGEERFYQLTTDLVEGTDYFVAVRAHDGFVYSEVREELMEVRSDANTPPPAPSHIDPDETNTTTPLLSWNAVTDEDGDTLTYELRIGTRSGGSELFDWRSTGQDTEYQVTSADGLQSGGYYVQVRANDSQDRSPVLEELLSVLLDINYGPEPPDSITPDTTVDTTPRITWTPGYDPNGDILTYELRVGTGSGGIDVLPWTGTGQNTYYVFTSPLDYGTYFVGVRCSDGQEMSDVLEEEMVIRSTNTAPEPPDSILPDETSDTTPYISWYGASDLDKDPLYHEVRIGTSSGGTEITEWVSTGSNDFYQVPDSSPLDFGTYYVQVRVNDGMEYSSVHEETVLVSESANTPPEPPNELKPRSTSDTQPTLRWFGAKDADGDTLGYWLQVGTSAAGAEIFSWLRADSNTYAFTRPLDYDQYYIQIRSNDGKANSSIFQDVMEVSSEGNRAPTSPLRFEPSETPDTTPEINWSGAYDDDGDALGYWLQIEDADTGEVVVSWTYINDNQSYQVINELTPGNTYYVTLVSYDGILNSSLPYVGTLKILEMENTRPDPPEWLDPAQTTDTTPELSWGPGHDNEGDALVYWLRLEETSGIEVFSWISVGTGTSYQMADPLAVGNYTVYLRCFDGLLNSSLAAFSLRIIPPYEYEFDMSVNPSRLEIEKGQIYRIELTIYNIGTGRDDFNVSIGGKLAPYCYIKESASGMAEGDPDAFKAVHRVYGLSLAGDKSQALTVVLLVPTSEPDAVLGKDDKLDLEVSSRLGNSSQSVSVRIKAEEKEGESSYLDVEEWESCLLPLILIVIIIVLLFAVLKKRKREPEEEAGEGFEESFEEDGFKESFDESLGEEKTVSPKPKKAAPVKPKKVPEKKKRSALDMDDLDLDSELASLESEELDKLRKRE